MNATHALASTIALASSLFALTMAAIMLALIVRRRQLELASAERSSDEMAASRYLMAALAGRDEQPAEPFDLGVERAAVTNLLRLVRGNDRAILLAIAERDDLFAETIADLTDRRPARRIDAMRLLEYYASPLCLSELGRILRTDRHPDVRLEAAAALARLGHLPPVDELIDALNLRRARLTRLHGALFRSLAERDAFRIVALAASADSIRLRPILVEALGWTGDMAMVQRLAGHAGDADPEVRCAAIRAARHIGHPAAGCWITPMLEDPVEAVRIQAAQTCGQLQVRDAIPGLERLATDPAWWVRTRARAALDLLRPHGRMSLTVVVGGGV